MGWPARVKGGLFASFHWGREILFGGNLEKGVERWQREISEKKAFAT